MSEEIPNNSQVTPVIMPAKKKLSSYNSPLIAFRNTYKPSASVSPLSVGKISHNLNNQVEQPLTSTPTAKNNEEFKFDAPSPINLNNSCEPEGCTGFQEAVYQDTKPEHTHNSPLRGSHNFASQSIDYSSPRNSFTRGRAHNSQRGEFYHWRGGHYHSPQSHQHHQRSPYNSPQQNFHRGSGVNDDIDLYYHTSMLDDPWAHLTANEK